MPEVSKKSKAIIIALLSVIVLGGFSYSTVAPYGIHIERLWDRDTKLRPFEQGISGIAEEYNRRSPAFRAVIAEFATCRLECPSGLFERYTATVRAEWTDIFDRLIIEKDWLQWRSLNMTHEAFLDIVEVHGKDTARTWCYPKIDLHHRSSDVPFPRFEAFICNPPGAAQARG